MIVEQGKYYLYRHIREDKNSPFYIGIGTIKNPSYFGISRYERAFSTTRNKIWHNIVDKTPFTVEILLESEDYSFLEEKEKEFIKLYGRINNQTGILANLTDGGLGNYGTVCPNSKRQAISNSNRKRTPVLNRQVSQETRKLISSSLKGRKSTPERIKASIKGRKRVALEKGYYISEEHKKNIGKANSKIVEQYSLDNILIETFESCHDVERRLGFAFQAISAVCKGVRKTAGGFIWKYKI